MELNIADEIELATFSNENELNWITKILRAELSEPYSIFTYNYFLTNWPDLTIMAHHKGQLIGCIIGSIESTNPKKAYIAMLVVTK
jgi:peptide alpha-N-acetyltransferase